MAEYKPNKGNGKGPILGSGNQPISEEDRIKFKAVDAKQTKMLKESNAAKKTATKPIAKAPVKKAAAVKAAPKKAAAKPAAKAPAKKVAPKKAK